MIDGYQISRFKWLDQDTTRYYITQYTKNQKESISLGSIYQSLRTTLGKH